MHLRKLAFTGVAILLFGISHFSFGQTGETDSIKHLLKIRTQNDTIRVQMLNELAYDNYGLDINNLKKYANQALLLATKLKYKAGEAAACKNLGLGYMLINGDPVALNYFERSLNLFTDLHDKVNQARVLNNIGYYYANLKEYQQSNYYFNQALEKIKGLHKTHFESILLGNIGNNYESSNDLSRAKAYYLHELRLAKDLTEDAHIVCYINLTSLSIKQGNYLQATAYLNKLAAYKKGTDFRDRDMVDLLRLQGEIDLGRKDFSSAQRSFSDGLNLANKTHSIDQRLAFYHNLFRLDSATGSFKSALTNNIKYHLLNDSVSNTNRNQQIALYQTRFELERRKEENQALLNAREKDQIVISHQHIVLVTVFFILVIIAAGLLYFKKINDEISNKNETINQQNQILKDTGQVKDKIFTVISHDLRSPIAQMITLMSLWETGELAREEMNELTSTVKGNIINTLELLDNLLIWSKKQLEGFKYDPVSFNLHELVEENIRGLKGLIRHKRINVNNNTSDIFITADKEMIKIVLRNLISNGLKFTPEEGSIFITEQIENGEVIIVVEDTGVGIKEADKAKIISFKSHTTLGTNKEQGTGLGLKLCYDFITMNKGKIWMESEERKGTKFFISLPNI
jgi:signal transduction histidine kinase